MGDIPLFPLSIEPSRDDVGSADWPAELFSKIPLNIRQSARAVHQ
jgi:hypothetical protein